MIADKPSNQIHEMKPFNFALSTTAIVLVICLSISLFFCAKHDVTPQPTTPKPVVPTSYDLYIYFRNSSGQDLWDPSTPNYRAQRIVQVSWYTNPGVIVLNDSVLHNTNNSLPSGYYLKVPKNVSSTGLTKYINLTGPIKTDTIVFTYDSTTLTQLRYNKTMIPPPTGQATFSAVIPLVITK
jgi:hypothetical protein